MIRANDPSNYWTTLDTLKRKAKHFWQRLTRGFDDSECWSLDVSLAKLIYPRLVRLKEMQHVHPCDMSEAQWADVMNKMIASFKFAANGDEFFDAAAFSDDDDFWKKHQDGIDLFAKYYHCLWD